VLSGILENIPLHNPEEPRDRLRPGVLLASDPKSIVTDTLVPVGDGNLALNGGGTKTWRPGASRWR